MKKITVVIACLILTFVNCSKDNNDSLQTDSNSSYLLKKFQFEGFETALEIDYNSNNLPTQMLFIEDGNSTPFYEYFYNELNQLIEIREYNAAFELGCNLAFDPNYTAYSVIERTASSITLDSKSYTPDGEEICTLEDTFTIRHQNELIKMFEYGDLRFVFEHDANDNLIRSYFYDQSAGDTIRGDELVFLAWDDNARPDILNKFSEKWIFPYLWFPHLYISKKNPTIIQIISNDNNQEFRSFYTYDEYGNTISQLFDTNTTGIVNKEYIPAN